MSNSSWNATISRYGNARRENPHVSSSNITYIVENQWNKSKGETIHSSFQMNFRSSNNNEKQFVGNSWIQLFIKRDGRFSSGCTRANAVTWQQARYYAKAFQAFFLNILHTSCIPWEGKTREIRCNVREWRTCVNWYISMITVYQTM